MEQRLTDVRSSSLLHRLGDERSHPLRERRRGRASIEELLGLRHTGLGSGTRESTDATHVLAGGSAAELGGRVRGCVHAVVVRGVGGDGGTLG
jgi:hypothetical protein